ncbi:MAG TPA: DUF4388 domain-containing protein [Thermoanaerobaculia bacterium]|nr:DUF4388 domain-containing protein [Thermoanaerobaculia bacterium]
MSDRDHLPTELRESLDDLREYLADQIPPLLAADGIGLLVARAPDALTDQVERWVSLHHQARRSTVRFADLAFHALRKLFLLGELALIPKQDLAAYLRSLVESLAPHCAPEDRELFRTSLERLRSGPPELSAGALRAGGALTSQAPGIEAPGDDPASGELARELRHFSLLLGRVKAPGGGAAPGAPRPAPGEDLVAALLSAAASSARDPTELGKYLQHLQQLGVVGADPADAVRRLTRALPAWAPAEAPEPETLGSSARAIHRLVDLAGEPMQRLARFEEVVGAIVEEANSGSLARAVALVQVASRLLADQRVPAADAEMARGRAGQSLDTERLRSFALDPRHHPQLRQLMAFFPGFRPEGLLVSLEDQPDRALRRLYMTLIEVHGPAARSAILERLEGALADSRDVAWFWQRNLVYLLHRIPCPPDELEERELEYVLAFSELGHHPRVVGEAVTRLGQIPHERAEGALGARFREVEAGIESGGLPGVGLEDLKRLRALLESLLLRGGSDTARRTVVQAALRRLREAGDGGALAELRKVDLSGDPALVDELLQALREALPRKLLGVTLRRNDEVITGIVQGLSSTPTPPVLRLLEELAHGYPREPFGLEAGRALAAFAAPPAPDAGTDAAQETTAPAAPAAQRMEGDLRLFGLPNLLQSLSQNELSGTLTLRDDRGAIVAVLELREGDLVSCSTSRLQGEEAFYQILERQAGTSFVLEGGEREARAGGAGGMKPQGILRLLMEGMRRHDEYQRARALVPDPAVLVPAGPKPTALPGETDGVFVRDLWTQVKGGATAAACEEALPTDPYRIRTLLAHWLAEGAVTATRPTDPALHPAP